MIYKGSPKQVSHQHIFFLNGPVVARKITWSQRWQNT